MFRILVPRTAGAMLAAVAACGCAFARDDPPDGAAPPPGPAPAQPARSTARDGLLLVVAPRSLAAAMEPLVAHKTKTGMPARLVVIESLEHESGQDDAERIKRAIFDSHERHGTRYVILAGDASLLPVRFRKVRQVPQDAYLDCTYNPTDHYYASLYKDHVPGTNASDPTAIVHSEKFDDWDADGDGVFDEQHWADDAVSYNPDRVDGCPDVAVGRLPAHTAAEAAAYVAKVIEYESTPSRFRNGARFSFVADARYGGAVGLCDAIVRDGVNVGFPKGSATRLLANSSLDVAAKAPWTNGSFDAIEFAVCCTGWVIYVGHADARSWSIRESGRALDAAWVASIGECEKQPVVLSVGCETGRFMCWAPSERYIDEKGQAHSFVWHADAKNWVDVESGKDIGPRLIVPRPRGYDVPDARDRTFACSWLFARAGAIVYVGESLVCENDKGADLVRDFLARGSKGGVLGDMWLEGQRRYWIENRASENVFRNPRIYLAIMTLFGDPSLRLQAATDEPAPARAPAVATTASPLTDLRAWDAATSAERRTAAESVAAREIGFRLSKFETFSCGGQTHEVAIYSHEKTGLEFVLVPAGTFAMGSLATEPERGDDEAQHAVTLTRPFLISRTECTQASWDRVGGVDGRKWRGADLPIESVSWDECSAWCKKVGLEIPTEAQWECAYRAGTTSRWFSGDDENLLQWAAWFRSNAGRKTHPVAQKLCNAFGLYDMAGNVREWCADWYDEYPSGAVTDPAGPPAGRVDERDGPEVESRVRRGGWYTGEFPSKSTRAAARASGAPNCRGPHTGFRPVRTVAP